MNWKEFFESTELNNLAHRMSIFFLTPKITEEERYQHFKARLLSEVVAKETITYFGDIVGTKVYELGEKE